MDTFSLFSVTPHRSPAFRLVAALAIGVGLVFTPSTARAVSEPSPLTGQKQSYGYSWQQELKLGADSDKEITASMGLYDNPDVQAYVAAVGQRVLQQSAFNAPNLPQIYRDTKFTFRVLDTPVVNAFALPGGYVYVTRGLLTHVDNEAQLAVVLGHEIGHVAARHSAQQQRRSQWTQLGVMAGAILGQKVLGDRAADIAPAIINATGQAAQLFLLRYSREAENEADALGVASATRAGYAAGESARFFQALQRLSATEGKALPTWQSTHPDPGDRAQHVIQLASANGGANAKNVGEGEYLKHIDGMIVGDDPREGFAQNGIFYHPTLRFQLPVAAGWKLNNQRDAVSMAEPNGHGQIELKLAPGTHARDAATQFAQQSKMQVTTSGDTQVNGLPTTVLIGQATTDAGAIGVWDAFIEMDGKVYSLQGAAPTQTFEQMRPTFESVAAGFSPLRDAQVASVQPAHLKIVRADRSAPFASFVPTALPQNFNADAVAIMNQVTLNDNVNEGQMLKVPDAPPLPQIVNQPAAYPNYQAQQQNYPGGYRNRQPNASQSYPPPTYPANGSNYPQQPQNYPPSNYPEASRYPQQPQNYPPASQSGSNSYPQQNYPPQNYPQPAPDSRNYPAQSYPGYPQPGSNYPSQSPAQPASGYPQFPQPNSATSNNAPQPPAQPPPPNWPR